MTARRARLYRRQLAPRLLPQENAVPMIGKFSRVGHTWLKEPGRKFPPLLAKQSGYAEK
jgi:hypothetical protein